MTYRITDLILDNPFHEGTVKKKNQSIIGLLILQNKDDKIMHIW